MIQVTSENNQLKVVTNGIVEYYSYTDIKNFSPFQRFTFTPNKVPVPYFTVIINFINENKNSPMMLKLSDIDNQATWVNAFAGAQVAVADLSALMNSAVNNQTVATAEYMTSAVPPVKTSGLLQVGAIYTITTYVATDDFSNVENIVSGTTNTTGCVFIATGDTPTDWTNGSTLTKGYVGDAIDTWDASDNFTTEAIVFNVSEQWALQVLDYNITPGTPTLSIQVSTDGIAWSNYKSASTNIDITVADNRIVFDDMMPFMYFRCVYTSTGSTGDFSLKIAK